MQVEEDERHLAAAVRMLHQYLQRKGGDSAPAATCKTETCDATSQQQAGKQFCDLVQKECKQSGKVLNACMFVHAAPNGPICQSTKQEFFLYSGGGGAGKHRGGACAVGSKAGKRIKRSPEIRSKPKLHDMLQGRQRRRSPPQRQRLCVLTPG